MIVAIETRKVGRYTVATHYDQDAPNPHTDWGGDIGRLVGCSGWSFSDHPADDPGHAYREARVGGPILALPVRVNDYGSGGTTVAECAWDRAEGVYWCALAETEAVADHNLRTVDDLRKNLRAELAQINAWLAGDCYGYTVEDDAGEVVDSCWGYVGPNEDDYALSEGVRYAEWATYNDACLWAGLPEWVRQTVLL